MLLPETVDPNLWVINYPSCGTRLNKIDGHNLNLHLNGGLHFSLQAQ